MYCLWCPLLLLWCPCYYLLLYCPLLPTACFCIVPDTAYCLFLYCPCFYLLPVAVLSLLFLLPVAVLSLFLLSDCSCQNDPFAIAVAFIQNPMRQECSESVQARRTTLYKSFTCTVVVTNEDNYRQPRCRPTGEPVWPSGKALGCKQKDLGSIALRLSFLFRKGSGLWTLSCDSVPHN